MRRALPSLLVLLLAIPIGCRVTPDTWTYSWTRHAYGTPGGWITPSTNSYSSQPCGDAQIYLAAIYLLPVIVDTVILPVTVVHDVRLEKERRRQPPSPPAPPAEPEAHGP
jgi:hypothetical protein